MCTAISYRPSDHFFGRNLDYEFSYNETVTVTPSRFPLPYRHMTPQQSHYAIIGMAYVQDNYPLYYDAANEKGLAMAGLNFPGNACYHEIDAARDNVASFELIPWLLGQCASVSQARPLLQRLQIVNTAFRPDLPPTPLHWLLADKHEAVVIESTKQGLQVYDDPVGVLTNNPSFPCMMSHLANYMNLSPEPAVNRFSHRVDLAAYSRGMGAMGLPGDLSSQSRFVRAAFTKENAVTTGSPDDSVNQCFHILGAASQQRGCCRLEKDVYEITIYSSCCDTTRGIYYYTTYGNRRISAVDMYRENLDGDKLITYPLVRDQDVYLQNG